MHDANCFSFVTGPGLAGMRASRPGAVISSAPCHGMRLTQKSAYPAPRLRAPPGRCRAARGSLRRSRRSAPPAAPTLPPRWRHRLRVAHQTGTLRRSARKCVEAIVRRGRRDADQPRAARGELMVECQALQMGAAHGQPHQVIASGRIAAAFGGHAAGRWRRGQTPVWCNRARVAASSAGRETPARTASHRRAGRWREKPAGTATAAQSSRFMKLV